MRYAKTRPVFDGYKAAKYSRKYLAEHEAELADYRAAKATMGELLGGEKLPKMAELKKNAANWRRGKRRSIPSTARHRRKCGRPWRSRPTSTICWASRTASAKGTGAIAHGDADKLLWDKMSQSRVWGGSPTSVFAARRDAKIASVATLALLAVSAYPGNPTKKRRQRRSSLPSVPRLNSKTTLIK